MKKRRILYFILAILAGVFMVAYAGIDDSPGGQVIGLVIIIVNVVLILRKKKTE